MVNMDEGLRSLLARQKREKEDCQRRIMALEAKLEQRHALEMEIMSMRGSVDVLKHIVELVTDEDIIQQLVSMLEVLKKKGEKL